jgi:hypothetical protein
MSTDIINKPKTIRRIYKGAVDETSKEKRTVTSIVTTDCVDRYREVIVAKGITLDCFRENPVVLWCHNGTIVIGKNLWIKRFTKDGKSGLIAKTLFAKTEKAEEVFQLYCDGFLNAWSIGANPDYSTWSPPTEEEIKARPDWKKARALYRKCELVEYSAVSIPANPEALGNECEKRIGAELRRAAEESPSYVELLLQLDEEPKETPLPVTEPEQKKASILPPLNALPPLVGRTFEHALAETRSMIGGMTSKSAAEKAAQDTLDRLKGRV